MDKVIVQFYNALSSLNAEDMVKHYHDDIVFKDPAFGTLKGEQAKNMWRMLCSKTKKMDVDFYDVHVENDDSEGSVRWEAHYVFTPTNRRIHNVIDAHFKFKDDKIIEHIDSFNLHRWSKQAFGIKGQLLGWTSFYKNKLQELTNDMLKKYETKHR